MKTDPLAPSVLLDPSDHLVNEDLVEKLVNLDQLVPLAVKERG